MNTLRSRIARVFPVALLLLAAAVAPAAARRLDVEVWTDRGNDAVYQPGDPMRVKVRTTEDAYLLVYELDSNGSVNLLFPWNRGAGRVEARRTLRLPDDASDHQLVVEQQTGQGFIVAIASDRPFRDLPWYLRPFDPQAAAVGYEDPRDDGDSERGRTGDDEGFDDDGRVMGDPYVAMERIRRRVMDRPADLEAFTSAYTTYYVHEQVRYPRYLCNDCHRPNRWAWWQGFDPYYTNCSVVDFRVNWGWAWGPQMWSGHSPYYYYVVRSDCPPRYQRWYDNRTRFSSWDGWNRIRGDWGDQLRRYKPTPAPVTYVPPAPRGQIWRQGQTPPGFVPPDVRRQGGSPGSSPAGWLQRDRGDGKPVWRDGPRTRPDGPGAGRGEGGGSGKSGGSQGEGGKSWRDLGRRQGDSPSTGEGRPSIPGRSSDEPRGESRPSWRERPRQDAPPPPPSDAPPQRERARQDPPRQDAPRQDPPRQQDPPRFTPPKQDPPREHSNPVWRQPPPPPAPKPEPAKGQGGKGKG